MVKVNELKKGKSKKKTSNTSDNHVYKSTAIERRKIGNKTYYLVQLPIRSTRGNQQEGEKILRSYRKHNKTTQSNDTSTNNEKRSREVMIRRNHLTTHIGSITRGYQMFGEQTNV